MNYQAFMAFAALASGAAAAAPAQMIRAQDPQTVLSTMQKAGYKAELATDSTGDPMIKSAYNGTTYQVLFYTCTNHRQCATVQFHAGYDFDKTLPLETMNNWNRTQRFGRAYLDKENDPILEMDVDLDDGGVSSELFIDNIEFWTSALRQFEKHIGYSN